MSLESQAVLCLGMRLRLLQLFCALRFTNRDSFVPAAESQSCHHGRNKILSLKQALGNGQHAEVVTSLRFAWSVVLENTEHSDGLRVPQDKRPVSATTTRQFDGLPTFGGVKRGSGVVVVVVDLLLTNIVRIQTPEFLPQGSHYPLPPPPCVACHSPRRHIKLQGRQTHWHWATRSVAPDMVPWRPK